MKMQKHETKHGLFHTTGGTQIIPANEHFPSVKNNRVNSPSKITLFKKTTIVNISISDSKICGNKTSILKKFF